MPVTRGGEVYAFNAGPGIGAQDILTMSGSAFDHDLIMPGNPAAGPSAVSLASNASGQAPRRNYLGTILAVFIVLVVLKIAGEHEKSGMQPAIAGIGVYNYIVIGLMAMLFILLGKVIANKYPLVPSVTDLFNAV